MRLIKNLSLVAAVFPRISWHQYLLLYKRFAQEGLEDCEVETLLKKIPQSFGLGDQLPFLEVTRLRNYLSEKDVHHVHPGHPLYPESLYQLDRPPLFFLLQGDLSVWGKEFLSVVGSRKFSSDSAVWMRTELKPFLEREKVCTVSGGAVGVDQEAHRLGVYHGGGTVAVLPSGLEQIYPRSFTLPSTGALFFSEWLPWDEVRPYYFKFRNRIIAALSRGLLIVEAGEKSGTMLTADWAADLGREIAVVPGSPLHSNFRGSLRLLQDGAALIKDREDLDLWWQHLR